MKITASVRNEIGDLVSTKTLTIDAEVSIKTAEDSAVRLLRQLESDEIIGPDDTAVRIQYHA